MQIASSSRLRRANARPRSKAGRSWDVPRAGGGVRELAKGPGDRGDDSWGSRRLCRRRVAASDLSSVGAPARENCGQGCKKDLDVAGKRPSRHVLVVEADHLLERALRAAVDRSE